MHDRQVRGSAWIWIGVEDAEKLHHELTARGVAIRMPLTNHCGRSNFRLKTLMAT